MARNYFRLALPGNLYIADIPRLNLREPSIVVAPKIIGIPATMGKLKNYSKKMEIAGERGVEKAAKYLLKETLKVTPKGETGKLRKSGNYVLRRKGKEAQGIVYFDEAIAPYAIYVHEDLNKKHKPPTMAKFLQRTQYRVRGELSRIVVNEIRKARP